MARLGKVAMTWGPAPVPTWEPFLGEGDVADPVQGVFESLRRLRLWVVNE